MSGSVIYSNLWKLLIERQLRAQASSSPYYTNSETHNICNSALHSYAGLVQESLKRYYSGSKLYTQPDNFASECVLHYDYEDVEDDCDSSGEAYVSGGVYVLPNDNTRTEDITKENVRFNAFLDGRSSEFLQELIYSDFEDGVENEITRLVKDYVKSNKYVTYCWIQKLFNQNRSNPVVTSGILRILGMVVDVSDAAFLMTMVCAGLVSVHTEDQEAAIMVVEKWRTRECLEAMRNTHYGSAWVKEYAMQVINELRQELKV